MGTWVCVTRTFCCSLLSRQPQVPVFYANNRQFVANYTKIETRMSLKMHFPITISTFSGKLRWYERRAKSIFSIPISHLFLKTWVIRASNKENEFTKIWQKMERRYQGFSDEDYDERPLLDSNVWNRSQTIQRNQFECFSFQYYLFLLN